MNLRELVAYGPRNLDGTQQKWPTPRANDSQHSKPGQKSYKHRLDRGYMAEVVMEQTLKEKYPTPTANDSKQGEKSYSQMKRCGLVGKLMREKFPTPTAADNRDRGGMYNECIKKRVKKGKQIMLSQHVKIEKTPGALSPKWVDWLMGYPLDWSKLDHKSCKEIATDIPDWKVEPDIPRLETGVKNRVQRLKGLGNAIVPQIACLLFERIKPLL